MDPLVEIIEVLDTQQKNEFENFLFIQRKLNGRRDAQLFKLMLEHPELTSEQLFTALYPEGNRNAYHTLRKRLYGKLQEFISLKLMEGDLTPSSSVNAMLNIGQFFIDKQRPKLALKSLQKAKRKALRYQFYAKHLEVLKILMINAYSFNLDYEVLFDEWKMVKQVSDLDEKITLSSSLIRSKLSEAKQSGEVIILQEMAESELAKLGIHPSEITEPSIAYRIAEIIRSTIVASKQYSQFENYVVKVFEGLKEVEAFKENDLKFELGFLYMIAHAKYRNRRLEDADVYIRKLRRVAEHAPDTTKNEFVAKFKMMRASIEAYSGSNENAIEIMKAALAEEKKLRIQDKLNMKLNLVVYYFQSAKYEEANALLEKFDESDRRIQLVMGKEWLFKKILINIILLVELGENQLAKARLKGLERTFKVFLSHDQYERVGNFLQIIRWVIDEPLEVASAKFEEKVAKLITRTPGDREDIQALTFYCWVKSKMLQRPYYEVLVETIQTVE
jgi:hypothetical protein